jgi:uncharacterized RmlC-like cupin family protein
VALISVETHLRAHLNLKVDTRVRPYTKQITYMIAAWHPAAAPQEGTGMAEVQFIDLNEEIKADVRGLSFFPWQGRRPGPGDLVSTFHLISITPGQSRGHHLHPGHAEWLYPFHGQALFIWEAAPGRVLERVITGDRTLVHIPPGLAHAVTNPGPEILYLLAWREASGPGPGDPETIPHPLGS